MCSEYFHSCNHNFFELLQTLRGYQQIFGKKKNHLKILIHVFEIIFNKKLVLKCLQLQLQIELLKIVFFNLKYYIINIILLYIYLLKNEKKK